MAKVTLRPVVQLFIDKAVVLKDGAWESVDSDNVAYHMSKPDDSYYGAILDDRGMFWATNDGENYVLALAVFKNGKPIDCIKILEAMGLEDKAKQRKKMRWRCTHEDKEEG